MQKTAAQIDISHLTLHLVNTVRHCCDIMHRHQDAGVCWKGTCDPVTEVDYLIQQIIVKSIGDKFKGIRIVGEEDLSFGKHPEIQNKIQGKYQTSLDVGLTVTSLPLGVQFHGEYPSDQLCVWIDPLDCTQGFISNRKHETTILVGVTCKQQPILGVIGHPYKQKMIEGEIKTIYEPTVNFGSKLLKKKACYQLSSDNKWKIIQQSQTKSKGRVAVGYRKLSNRCSHLLKKLKVQPIRMGGAGYKCLKVIRNQVDLMVFIDAATSKWDSCAAQAIILGMGGHCLKPDLQNIGYDPCEEYLNREGFILTLNQGYFRKFVKYFEKQREIL